jgi:hypothetical protein
MHDMAEYATLLRPTGFFAQKKMVAEIRDLSARR